MHIFDRFPTPAAAAAFVRGVTVADPDRQFAVYLSADLAQQADPTIVELTPPVVHVARYDDGDDGDQLAHAAELVGGRYVGT